MKVALSIVFVPLWVIIKSANININLSVSSLLRFLHGFHSDSNKWGKKITYSKFNFSLLCWYGYFPSSTTTKSSWSRSGWKSSAKMSRLHWLWRLRKKPLQWFYQLWCNSLNLWLWWYISPLVVVSSSNTDEPSIHLLCYTLNSAGSHLSTNGPEAVNTLVCGWKLKYLAMSMIQGLVYHGFSSERPLTDSHTTQEVDCCLLLKSLPTFWWHLQKSPTQCLSVPP